MSTISNIAQLLLNLFTFCFYVLITSTERAFFAAHCLFVVGRSIRRISLHEPLTMISVQEFFLKLCLTVYLTISY